MSTVSNRGFSLVEVMIALVIFTLIVVPTISFLQREHSNPNNLYKKVYTIVNGELDCIFKNGVASYSDTLFLDNEHFYITVKDIKLRNYNYEITISSKNHMSFTTKGYYYVP